MQGLTDTALLAGPSTLERPAILGATHDWRWREIHAAAAQLAGQLTAHGTVCNLCYSRAGFLITWLACARRACLQILPPSAGDAELAAILDAADAPTVVADDAALLQPWATRARCLLAAPDPAAARGSTGALQWTPDWDAPAVCLYTSGTTGTPEAQMKTLGQLAMGARVLAQRLGEEIEGGLASVTSIVCSVPQQHMFGLEASVMLPLLEGLPVLERRPLLPMDVGAALQRCGGRAMWVATPLHLRALAPCAQALSHCALALVSTMPLAPALAAQAEVLIEAPVVEIYGSTETGVMATRRTASGAAWTPVDGVRFDSTGDGTFASGRHFPSPCRLADQLAFDATGRFELMGRHADLIKIGGRRASLAQLNLLLQQLPGLQDGTFFLPDDASPTARLVLMHAGALDRAATTSWLRERMDPIFLPRRFIRLDRLPRSDNGKLARPALAAAYAAHMQAIQPARADIRFEFDFQVDPAHPCLAGHFPGRPVVPGVLLVDHVIEGLRGRGGHAVTGLQKVKFMSPLLPGERALVHCEAGGSRVSFRVTALCAGAQQALAQGTALLPAASPRPAAPSA